MKEDTRLRTSKEPGWREIFAFLKTAGLAVPYCLTVSGLFGSSGPALACECLRTGPQKNCQEMFWEKTTA